MIDHTTELPAARQRPTSAPWHHVDQGSGRPLVLLHGIGMSHHAWAPVLPLLTRERRVIAFDTPGFGGTPPLHAEVPPTIPHLVDSLADSLRALDLNEPVDLAGNSMGGLLALEAARRGLARSVVALSPAGLWDTQAPRHAKALFGALRLGYRLCPACVRGALQQPLLRELLLWLPIGPGSRRLSAENAQRIAKEFALCPGFNQALAHMGALQGGKAITVPLTVAFGSRDAVLPRFAQRRDRLPSHTRWLRPASWGHVPMAFDPEGVARLILEGTA